MTQAGQALRIPDNIASGLVRLLEDEIVYGEIEPGARLLEEEVSIRYGVSRSPVREALHRLERDGLAVRTARRGFFVSRIGRQDLAEVYSCRIALEGLAAKQAASNRTDGQARTMREVLIKMQKAAKRGDARVYFRHNVALTGHVYEAAGNRTLARLLSQIEKQARRYRYMAYANRAELIAQSVDGNEQIVGAIAAGQPRTARRVTERLIRNSWKAIDAYFQSAGFDG